MEHTLPYSKERNSAIHEEQGSISNCPLIGCYKIRGLRWGDTPIKVIRAELMFNSTGWWKMKCVFFSWSERSQHVCKESSFRSASCKMFSRTVGPKAIFLVIKCALGLVRQLQTSPPLASVGTAPPASRKNVVKRSQGGVLGPLPPGLKLHLPFCLWERFGQHVQPAGHGP